jgi:hypothetical protein
VQFFQSLAQLMAKTATVSQTEDDLTAPMGCDCSQSLDAFEEDGSRGQALFRRQSIEGMRVGLWVSRNRRGRVIRRLPLWLPVEVDEDFRLWGRLQGLKAARAERVDDQLILNHKIPITRGADCDGHVADLLYDRADEPRYPMHDCPTSRRMQCRAAAVTSGVAACLERFSADRLSPSRSHHGDEIADFE